MATYKVIQDIEAEDKLIGPLSLRQFIYAIIVVVSGFIAFKIILTPAWWISLLFIPHMVLFGLLAAPFGQDQSSEVWLLAKIRFSLKPRRRIWDQSGLKELVTITVPKRIERQLTDGLSQTEVKSRLEALANTIDSRGWAVKNVNVNLFSQPSYLTANAGSSDRLVDPSSLPQEVPSYDTQSINDVLDADTSATAQHFDELINSAAAARKAQLTATMQQASGAGTSQAQPANYWFMNETPQPTTEGQAAFDAAPVITPGSHAEVKTPAQPQISKEDEEKLLDKIHKQKKRPNPMNSHLKRIKTSEEKAAEAKKKTAEAQAKPVTPAPRPDILELAKNNDLNVDTIARQARKVNDQEPPDEVVISLR